MSEQLKAAEDILKTVDKLHQEEMEQIKLEIENAFSREQANIITQLFTNTYRNTVLQHENSFSCIYTGSILSAFFELLVESKGIITLAEFEASATKHLNTSLENLNKATEAEKSE